ncbi:glycosyltransferase family 2 protein [Oscillibacter sp.]|uniref:glycosyltransferase family 2 protein n=1 Tax=Oscillibacter sp. TaxID=1945593 RepID=UPI002D810C05|nr:glycosyltransferase family 2 protein [Oscillibacter sp.]
MSKVNIYCRVFNVKPYLEQCISSVLSQTHGDFAFYVIDNGCTDGSSEIIDSFAARDARIRVIRFEKNTNVINSLYKIIQRTAEGYITILDSDDWLAPDYLEKLLRFAEEQDLDIACTGSYMQKQDTGEAYVRSISRPLVMERRQLASFFASYHVFFRTYWGKLFRAEALPQDDFGKFARYGGDTLYAFDALRRSRRVGVDSSVLHYYRVRGNSVSYSYNTARFPADIALYDDALQFLSGFGPLSAENRQFLRVVFANAVMDSVRVLSGAKLSPGEKAAELRKITTHSFTRDAYKNEPSTRESHDEVMFHALEIARLLDGDAFADMEESLRALLPGCGKCVTGETFPLFCAEPPLMEALINDDPDRLLDRLLLLMQGKRYVKQYPLGNMAQALAEGIPLLRGVNDMAFLGNYAAVCRMIWQGRTEEALDEMTGLLLEDRVQSAKETFLQVYLNAAALLEEIPAYIFGNIRLAEFYLRQGRREECRAVLNSLEEMGVEENEEIAGLRRSLKEA